MPPNDKFTFRGQRASEEAIFAIHQHPWFFFKPGVKVIAAIVILVLVIKFAGLSGIFSIAFAVLGLFIAYETAQVWFRWTNTTYVLTNERIIAVAQNTWFSRSVTEAPLANIMTVNHEIAGPIHSMLNFGNVAIRSSGATENEIVLKNVYDPFDVQQRILDTAKK